MEKEEIRLELEIGRCPIFCSDLNDGEIFTEIEVIDNDPIVKELNYKLGCMYTDYFEFDSHDEACWFNQEQADKDKDILYDLNNRLVKRLNEINDGSYVVVDKITNYLNKLLK